MEKDKNNLTWEEVKTEHIIQDEWMDFRRSSYRLPDGTVFGPYYSYSRRDYVVIAASDEDGRFLCVRQFRQGIKEITTEFPAGGIERAGGKEYRTRGDAPASENALEAAREDALASGNAFGAAKEDASASENALEAAKRELLEETGYVSDDWTHLLTVPSNATIADNYAYLFRAENCRKAGGQKLDGTEFLVVEKYTAEEIEEMIHSGRFQQAVHVAAWLLAKEEPL